MGDAPCLVGVWGDALYASVHFWFRASHPFSPSPAPLSRALCSDVFHSACPMCGFLTFFHQLSISEIRLQSSWMLMFLSQSRIHTFLSLHCPLLGSEEGILWEYSEGIQSYSEYSEGILFAS